MEREELAAWLRLTLTPGVGNGTARKLLAAFGLPQAIFAQPANALAQVASPAQVASLRVEPPALAAQLETTWRWLHHAGKRGIEEEAEEAKEAEEADAKDAKDASDGDDEQAKKHKRHGSGKKSVTGHRCILALGDAGYPKSLLNIEDPPLMLYLLGAASIEISGQKTSFSHVLYTKYAINIIVGCLRQSMAQSVAIVGSRNPTPQGLDNARQFARALCQAGLAVVSGMALGVDGAAHEGALEGYDALTTQKKAAPGPLATIAVVGTGLDRVYPSSHRALAHAIAQNGLIISEYPLGTPPMAANFPKRNRLIAGLAQGTLVVEAALKSGSLITARMAAEQGKEVFVIPGSIHSTQSRGCHALIREGAKLVESPQDVLEDLKIECAINIIAKDVYRTSEKGKKNIQGLQSAVPEAALDLGTDAADAADDALLTALGFDPVSLDALQARTGIDTAHLQAQLMTLELQGAVARLPGGLFQRSAAA